jgi:hypothetical protein
VSKRLREMPRQAMQKHCPFPVFFGFDDIEKLRAVRKSGEPWLFMDHAYFHRGYRHNAFFRVIYKNIHQTKALDVPGDRLEFFKVKRLDWKNTRDHVVFIPAPRNIEALYGPWNEKALQRIASATKRPIKIKAKTDGSLGDFLHRSWGLVAHSSVAAVEAACLGFPVFGPDTSPAFPVSASIDDIENPVRPDREPWLRTLAYSQFTTEEIENGKAWGIIRELHGL